MSIHPTAVVDPSAELDPSVELGPYVIIGRQVKIGANTTVLAHVFIADHTEIGRDNEIMTGAVIGLPPQHLGYKKGTPCHTSIGDRNTLREYVTINGSYVEGKRTCIGNDCYLMGYAHVAHDCTVGNQVVIANSSVLGGHVTIEDRVFLSGLVAVHQFCRVGTLVMAAGLCRVSRDVPPYMMTYGDSEVIGLNTVGLRRAGISAEARAELKKAYKTIYEERRSLPSAIEALKSTEHGPEVQRVIEFLEGTERGICGRRRAATPGARKSG